MQGHYNIYQNGKITNSNIITDAGKNAILNSLAGHRLGFASSIVAGIGTTATTTADTNLDFLVSGGDVNVTIPDSVNGKIYFKASLPIDDEYTIYELGCYGSQFSSIQNVSQSGLLISSFTSDQDWVDVLGTHIADQTHNRVGNNAVSYSIAASATAKGQLSFLRDFNLFQSTSIFRFAYYVNNLTNFTIRLKVDDSNYFETALTTTNGYHIASVVKSSFVSTGTPDWSSITVFEFEATATGSTGTASLDAMRIDATADGDNSILSRTVLLTPLKKFPGVQMDIEYVLEPSI